MKKSRAKTKSRKGRDGIHVWVPWTTYDRIVKLTEHSIKNPKLARPKTHAGIIAKGLEELELEVGE